jgi:hypothetical protein
MRISISHTIRRIYAIILRCAKPPCPLFNLSVNLQSRQKQRCSLNYKRAQKKSQEKTKEYPQNVGNHGALITNSSINFASAAQSVVW